MGGAAEGQRPARQLEKAVMKVRGWGALGSRSRVALRNRAACLSLHAELLGRQHAGGAAAASAAHALTPCLRLSAPQVAAAVAIVVLTRRVALARVVL